MGGVQCGYAWMMVLTYFWLTRANRRAWGRANEASGGWGARSLADSWETSRVQCKKLAWRRGGAAPGVSIRRFGVQPGAAQRSRDAERWTIAVSGFACAPPD